MPGGRAPTRAGRHLTPAVASRPSARRSSCRAERRLFRLVLRLRSRGGGQRCDLSLWRRSGHGSCDSHSTTLHGTHRHGLPPLARRKITRPIRPEKDPHPPRPARPEKNAPDPPYGPGVGRREIRTGVPPLVGYAEWRFRRRPYRVSQVRPPARILHTSPGCARVGRPVALHPVAVELGRPIALELCPHPGQLHTAGLRRGSGRQSATRPQHLPSLTSWNRTARSRIPRFFSPVVSRRAAQVSATACRAAYIAARIDTSPSALTLPARPTHHGRTGRIGRHLRPNLHRRGNRNGQHAHHPEEHR